MISWFVSYMSLFHPQCTWHRQPSLPGSCFFYPVLCLSLQKQSFSSKHAELLSTISLVWLLNSGSLRHFFLQYQSIVDRSKGFGLYSNPFSYYVTCGKVLNFSVALQGITHKIEIIIAPTPVVIMRITSDNLCKALQCSAHSKQLVTLLLLYFAKFQFIHHVNQNFLVSFLWNISNICIPLTSGE